ncbi:ABC transporter substrate-binding protein [Mycetocola sp. JXN-3]|uniref:ABC transporter substrate-binding protein n=1 Tax=Mycetocola sp. JXN-3 TaxID=2116510 RepID=UPI00165D1499|nr:ABC transporter substrate-binding protein [Mycetocola sp. JXN-3]
MNTQFRFRKTLLALGGAALALALAACSTSAPGGEDASASAATRSVSTANGSVKIPAHPKRIVSIHSFSTESLLDFGITPVGVEDAGAEYVPQRYLKRWEPIEKVVQGGKVNLEKIAALKPDLIIGVDVPYLRDVYPKLEAIAPTVFAPFDEKSTWATYPAYTADYINAEPKLTELKKRYDDRIAEVSKKYADQLAKTKWDIIQGGFDDGNYWIYSDKTQVGTVLSALGAKFASATAGTPAGQNQSVSYERTDLLSDADAIVYYENNDGTPANNIAKLFALPGYQELPAVKAGLSIGTQDFLSGSYSDSLGIIDSIESTLKKIK